jgi:hypothetical protein
MMNTAHITETIPSAIVDTLSEVGAALETGAEAVGGVLADRVSSGRRLASSITTPSWMPGPTARSNRRWWLAAGALVLVGVIGAVWYSRRSNGDSTTTGVADLDQRRSVA